MKYDVLTYGDAKLRRKAEPVTAVDDRVRQLACDMIDTMHTSNGVGLAAEQVGSSEALCVIDVPPSLRAKEEQPAGCDLPMPLVMLNPRITEMQGEQVGQEGCLSFPDIFVTIRRARDVTAVFTDMAGRERTVHATGLVARAVQHELDHLAGVLLVDRMSAVQKVAVATKLRRLKRAPVHLLRVVTGD